LRLFAICTRAPPSLLRLTRTLRCVCRALPRAPAALSVSDAPPIKKQPSGDAASAAPPAPKPAPAPAAPKPSPAAKPPGFFPFSTSTSGGGAAAGASGGAAAYPHTGEGLRDAIKAGDAPGAAALLAAGVDANFVDAQGMTLLHVAAVFNAGGIALALLEAGARVDTRNAQGETPLDCAPPSLAHRLRARAQELADAKA
jgi:hypothetical protein